MGLPLGGFPACARPPSPAGAPKVLVFAPHPDDECIVGALALRLLREAGMTVVNVAVTQGSNRARQAARFEELRRAVGFLGFGLIQARENGLEGVNLKSRAQQPEAWAVSVSVIEGILDGERPQIVFIPHAGDWNSTHIGTHHLVMDALGRLGGRACCHVVETEFWGALPSPNVMVESGEQDVADLVAATSFHVGEVNRNPYHLRLPSWMQDNVRRGGELVGGQGGVVPDFMFATLYRICRWDGAGLVPAYAGGRFVAAGENPAGLFA